MREKRIVSYLAKRLTLECMLASPSHNPTIILFAPARSLESLSDLSLLGSRLPFSGTLNCTPGLPGFPSPKTSIYFPPKSLKTLNKFHITLHPRTQHRATTVKMEARSQLSNPLWFCTVQSRMGVLLMRLWVALEKGQISGWILCGWLLAWLYALFGCVFSP